MKKTFLKLVSAASLLAFPYVTFALTLASPAASAGNPNKTLRDVIDIVIQYFQVFIILIIALAVLTFVWNVYNYFFKADLDNKKEAGLYVMYSVIGFFVILSVWGLVNILRNSIKLNNDQPELPFTSGSVNGGTGAPNRYTFPTTQ